MTLAHYWIVSPPMDFVVRILDDGSGPTETFADVVCVEASSKREAIRLGVKAMEIWPKYARHDLDVNPFSGVKAESALCPHGLCHCDIEGCSNYPERDLCPECLAEHDSELLDDRSLMDDPERPTLPIESP